MNDWPLFLSLNKGTTRLRISTVFSGAQACYRCLEGSWRVNVIRFDDRYFVEYCEVDHLVGEELQHGVSCDKLQ